MATIFVVEHFILWLRMESSGFEDPRDNNEDLFLFDLGGTAKVDLENSLVTVKRIAN